MFLPFKLRGLELANRVVVSPMAQYCATDGVPDDWHLVHYGHSALGGGRSSVYRDDLCFSRGAHHARLYRPVERHPAARLALHRRVRASGERPPRSVLRSGIRDAKAPLSLAGKMMDHPLASGNWFAGGTLAPCLFPELSQAPIEMTRTDLDKVRADFIHATRLGLQAEFDMLELHMAHGYLLASFLSPLTNNRCDSVRRQHSRPPALPSRGAGSGACRRPAHKPLSVRISATGLGRRGTDR